MTLVEQLAVLRSWSVRVFPDHVNDWEYNTRHIESELAEVRADPLDVTEWMDIVILAFDGAMRAGHSPEEVVAALEHKLQVVYQRKYTKGPDGLMRHS